MFFFDSRIIVENNRLFIYNITKYKANILPIEVFRIQLIFFYHIYLTISYIINTKLKDTLERRDDHIK